MALDGKGREDEKLMLERMVLDEDGFPQPTGEFEELAADTLVLALGQESDLSLLVTLPDIAIEGGVVQVGPDMMTGHPGVFAGGDMVPAERTLTEAIGHGKQAAPQHRRLAAGDGRSPAPRHELATAGMLNTWYYADAPKRCGPVSMRPAARSTFDEVVGGLDESTALFEARRCMSCGNCFQCDNCFGVCPDNAVMKVDEAHGYSFDYDYCKGCGLCVQECPCGAIEMEPEEI